MPPQLKQYLNRTIMVSIPALFEDGKCHACTLQAIDSDGLWLESSALVNRLLPEHEKATATRPGVFVPTAQIAAVILAAPSPVVPSTETDNTAARARNTSAAAAATTPKPPAATSAKAASPAESPVPKTTTSS
jgi:hypothetical protein